LRIVCEIAITMTMARSGFRCGGMVGEPLATGSVVEERRVVE